MQIKKHILFALVLTFAISTFAVSDAYAKSGNEYDAVVNHLKTRYRAKKVKIPFMWLARMAVGVVRPAGVKSFSVTLFQDLQFSRETLDAEMQGALKNSFGAEWSPVFHVRSREGEQVYMYMREVDTNIKLMVVTIDKNQASIIRAKFSPDRLAEFINNPKIFGINLNDSKEEAKTDSALPTTKASTEKKTEETKENN
jgi:hypothetical protein